MQLDPRFAEFRPASDLLAGRTILVTGAGERLELVCDTYLSVTTPVQLAAGTLLERSRPVAGAILERVRTNHAALRRLAARYPACGVLPAEGGWYAVVQVPAIRSEEALVIGTKSPSLDMEIAQHAECRRPMKRGDDVLRSQAERFVLRPTALFRLDRRG